MKYQLPLNLGFLPIALSAAVLAADVSGQERFDKIESQMTLRKSAEARDYKGRPVQGENRRIAPGDSLWRILIQEKGLAEKKFNQYVIIIQNLNPQMKSASVLRVGDTVFIPMQPDEVLVAPSTVAKSAIAPSQTFGND